jgi:hypothetical protein
VKIEKAVKSIGLKVNWLLSVVEVQLEQELGLEFQERQLVQFE